MIPAGIRKGETEFYRDGEEMQSMHSGTRTEIKDLPASVLSIVKQSITPKHEACLDQMGIVEPFDRLVQFLKCNCSAYDFTPDIIDGRSYLQREYVPCSFRGSCRFEGQFCQSILIDGVRVTMAELRITSYIRQGYHDKEICDMAGIKPQTLRVHKQHIQTKLGAERKPQVAMKAVQFGIE